MKYPQANLSHNTSCTLPVQRSSSLTCCDFWYKSCKFNCARPVQVSGRSELTELPSSQLWERTRPRVWAPSRKASVNPPTPLIDPCSRPSPASSWWPPWQPRRCWSCSGLAPPCCPGPAGRARLSETRAKQKMRSEKKITPLTVEKNRVTSSQAAGAWASAVMGWKCSYSTTVVGNNICCLDWFTLLLSLKMKKTTTTI